MISRSIQRSVVCELEFLRTLERFDFDQFYDYCLTVRQEVVQPHLYNDPFVSPCSQMIYIWKARFALASTLFACARYPTFLTAIPVLLPARSRILVNSAIESHYPRKPSPQ